MDLFPNELMDVVVLQTQMNVDGQHLGSDFVLSPQ